MILEVRKKLFEYSDVEYRKFMEKLIPGSFNIIGVRTGELRKIAKVIFKSEGWEKYVLSEEGFYHEEFILQGMLIGLERKNLAKSLFLMKIFIPRIKNWAVCDSFCSELKIVKSHRKEFLKFLKNYTSEGEYENRFIFVMFLKYFIEKEYLIDIFYVLGELKKDFYYVKMAKAWLLAEVAYNYFGEVVEYLENCNRLDDFTFKKTIQKICESEKISPKQKEAIKKIKRN